ncbi:MAG: hypothetical protein HGB35_04370, partial [Geobacteraceae bacterium]|nr:hypothetical protein [Geobacteraceae bacterium]
MPDRPVHVQIQELSQHLVDISTREVGNLFEALRAVKYQDKHSAPRIKLVKNELDMEEIDLEEKCIQFIALQHPVAKDLRTIIAIIMISDELERIGDISLNIIDSMRNCNCISLPFAPIAMRMPISRVRSVTETSMMFMIPIP